MSKKDKKLKKLNKKAQNRAKEEVEVSVSFTSNDQKGTGIQSFIPEAFEEIPPNALAVEANILYMGREKYGKDNWRKISVENHIGRAIRHLYKYLEGDLNECHLGNASCRIHFAHELAIEQANQQLHDMIKEQQERIEKEKKDDSKRSDSSTTKVSS